ncbi:AAA family ATPase [Shewanella sp. HL-SH5]|uniref:AAA family ATPase n=1 Tax=Shewanella sp. HL-SH5 TaxID=3436241 RepID=UPI003EBD8EB3
MAYLEKDHWDDYSFRTSFNLIIIDSKNNRYDLGHIKVGYTGQFVPDKEYSYTFKHLPKSFSKFDDIFSLGQDVEYYRKLMTIPEDQRKLILEGLNDVASDLTELKKITNEKVFRDSLCRNIDEDEIREKFNVILSGSSKRTEFDFKFSFNDIELEFETKPESIPPSNIHVLIGRNGSGKTTLLNNMAYSQLSFENGKHGKFYQSNEHGYKLMPADYFKSVVLVSFSAFDSFEYPEEYNKRLKEEANDLLDFSYIGLKENLEKGYSSELKSKNKLQDEFIESLKRCFRFGHTKKLWVNAIKRLQSDDNFEDMKLTNLAKDDLDINNVVKLAKHSFSTMSSGHAIVLLIITKLITEVKERSLVLLDEPEGHLHPPLLSAFMSSLSDLLIYRNGIAIIATHSPVVLQEVPKKCVWNIIRYTQELTSVQRFETETYAENTGILTREVFGLEVKESGFHKQLTEYVESKSSYEEILGMHKNQLGLEGRSILKALIYNRDKRQG